MSTPEAPALNLEWVTLQNNFEQYERNALVVKLAAVVLFAAALLFALTEAMTATLVAVLWVQEAVMRTFQARLGTRILRIEALLREGGGAAMQLHSQWLEARQGVVGMLGEYARAGLRPTVAFPYAALLLVELVLYAAASGESGTAV